MSKTCDTYRVFLAVTERSPLADLWKVAEEQMKGTGAQLVTLFVDDARWRRAASLPFTQEVSRVSGSRREFTAQRAAQIGEHVADRLRRQVRELAAGAELQIKFEVVTEHEVAWLSNIGGGEQDVFIVPSHLKQGPMITELSQLSCRVLFVDTGEE